MLVGDVEVKDPLKQGLKHYDSTETASFYKQLK